jgi:hypothetical protein
MNDVAETHLATFTKLAAARTEIDRARVENVTLRSRVERLEAALRRKEDEVTALRRMVVHVAGGARGVVL